MTAVPGYSTLTRAGRAIVRGVVREIVLPAKVRPQFKFSRYTHILHPCFPSESGSFKILCTSAESDTSVSASARRHAAKFWSKVQGYEAGHRATWAGNTFQTVPLQLDLLQDAEYVYAHPAIDSVLDQLKISKITPFFRPETFQLRATGEKVAAEAQAMATPEGRTAAFEKSVVINGEPYFLEVKGVNCGDQPILPTENFWNGGEAVGALSAERMQRSIDAKRVLNAAGYDSSLLLCAYLIPGVRQFNGKPLGAYVRAVKSTPPLSHFYGGLPHVAQSLEFAPQTFADDIVRAAARDMARIWGSGLVHGYVHEQNMRISGLTDFSGCAPVRQWGFNGVALDAEMLASTCRSIAAQVCDEPETDERPNIEQAWRTRGIITQELNRALNLRLPPIAGTATIAAAAYDWMKTRGLTDSAETLRIEHTYGSARWPAVNPISLDDLLRVLSL